MSKVIPVLALLVGLCGILAALFLPLEQGLTEACPWLAQNQPWLPSLASMARALGISLVSAPTAGARDPESGLLFFTVDELAKYDGSTSGLPILLAVKGFVFDVTAKGSDYYGKGRAYNCFAGKDSTRALTLGSLRPEDIGSTDISDFTPAQMEAAEEQRKFYEGKYELVGKLWGARPWPAASPPPAAAAAAVEDSAPPPPQEGGGDAAAGSL